jgi:hypothetical protein
VESHGTSLVFPPTTSSLFLFRSPFSCRGRTFACGVVQPVGGVALIPSLLSAPCSFAGLYPRGRGLLFYKRMKSSLFTIKRELRGAHPFSFSAATGWPLGKHSPAASRERGVGDGPTYPEGAVERFHMPSRRAELQCVIVVCHLVSSSQHRRVPMHYVPVH